LTLADFAIKMQAVPDSPTPLQRLATVLLGQDLAEWVAERRDPEVRHSWQLIARQLRKATAGEVDVSGETLRVWYGADDPAAQPAEAAS
jgi:hypothetical protein